MAAMQTEWTVPAIRTTGPSTSVVTTNQPSDSHDNPDHPDVQRILRLRSNTDGRGVRWQATVCDVNGLRDITWWSASDTMPFHAGQLIRTSSIAAKGDHAMALQIRHEQPRELRRLFG